MIKVIIVLLFLNCHTIFSQTIIVAILEKNKITVGADSKGSNLHNGPAINICKVVFGDSMIYTGVGIRILETVRIAKLMYKRKVDFNVYTKSVEDTLKIYWRRTLSEIKKSDKNSYDDALNKPSFSSLIICKIVNGTPKLCELSFSVKVKGPNDVAIGCDRKIKEKSKPDQVSVIFFGKYEALLNEKRPENLSYTQLINHWIERASVYYSESVGLPASIAVISNDKFGFIQNGLCQK